VLLVDTSGVLAALNDTQSRHDECAAALDAATAPLLLSPFILAELDYLIGERVGEQARLAFLEEVEREAFRLEPFSATDLTAAVAVVRHYADFALSLADASIVVLSERYGVHDLLTLDERHFRVLRGAHGLPFRVLPADA
jgi:predicted nucleic acid-binding protein